MTPIRALAEQVAGFNKLVKVREHRSPAIKQRPIFDVLVKETGQRRGRWIFSIVRMQQP